MSGGGNNLLLICVHAVAWCGSLKVRCWLILIHGGTLCVKTGSCGLLEPEFVARHRLNPRSHQLAIDDWREVCLLPLGDLFEEE